MNNILESTWKETVVAYFKVLFQNLPGGTEKIHGNFNQDSRFRAEFWTRNLAGTIISP
jgi:hypothetical protein